MERGWKLLVFTVFFVFPFLVGGAAAADSTPPETTVFLTPETPDGSNDWYRTPVRVTLSSSDLESGIASINWRLNGGGWQSTVFSGSLNLAPNPSFENGSPQPSSWTFLGTPLALGLRDSSVARFGLSSAKITAVQNGWSSFRNEGSYVVASPWESLVASFWVKTEGVSGVGAYFRVFALSPSGAFEIAVSPALSGTNGWTRVAKEFIVTVSDADGIFLDLGLEGVGSVWFDGVSVVRSPVDTSTTFTVSPNGQNLLEYYSVDQVGNSEQPYKEKTIKIDTAAPANWRDFAVHEAGNDHTLWSEIKVDDNASGLDNQQTSFQYSVNGGLNWGYYEEFLSCSSTWNESGWSGNLSFPGFTPGGQAMTINTPPVDFCNSNWSVCKIVRFKTKDLAGNESTKDICIYGAWVKTEGKGDIYGGGGINMSAAGAGDNSDGMVVSGTGVAGNFTSSENWILLNYPLAVPPSYDEWLAKVPSPTPITILPSQSGYFLVNSDFTIASSTIPANLSTAAFGAALFINGNLTINSDFSFANGGALVFIVKGKIEVDRKVKNIAGYFLTDGSFDSAYNGGGSSESLRVYGGVAARAGLKFSRSLKANQNTNLPAEMFIFQPKYFLLTPSSLGVSRLSWGEVSP